MEVFINLDIKRQWFCVELSLHWQICLHFRANWCSRTNTFAETHCQSIRAFRWQCMGLAQRQINSKEKKTAVRLHFTDYSEFLGLLNEDLCYL